MSTVAVWTPGRIDGGGTRLPTPANASQVHPGAVRRKVIVEIGDVGWSVLDSGGDWFGAGFGGRNRRGGLWRDHGRLRLIPEGGVAIKHRADDGRGYAKVVEIEDIINGQIERALSVLDVGEDNSFAHTRTGEANDFSGAGGKVCRRSLRLGGIGVVGGGLGWDLLAKERQSRCQN